MSRNKPTAKAKHERNDYEALKLFITRAEELFTTSLGKKGISTKYHASRDDINGTVSTLKGPDEEELRSYLLTLRQFLLKEEPIFLNRIYNICRRRANSEDLKNNIKQARQYWKKQQEHNGLIVMIDGNKVKAIEMCNWWINGKYFHNDMDYQEKIAKADQISQDVYRLHFLTFVIDASEHIRYLHNIISEGLRDRLFQFDETPARGTEANG